MLSGVQQRNLESAWGLPVLDRVGLIIEIFAQRARTREARLQVLLYYTSTIPLTMLLSISSCMPRVRVQLSKLSSGERLVCRSCTWRLG